MFYLRPYKCFYNFYLFMKIVYEEWIFKHSEDAKTTIYDETREYKLSTAEYKVCKSVDHNRQQNTCTTRRLYMFSRAEICILTV